MLLRDGSAPCGWDYASGLTAPWKLPCRPRLPDFPGRFSVCSWCSPTLDLSYKTMWRFLCQLRSNLTTWNRLLPLTHLMPATTTELANTLCDRISVPNR